MNDNLTIFGGKPVLPAGVRDIKDAAPEDIAWNFGVQPETAAVTAMIQASRNFHDVFPQHRGKWAGMGKPAINHYKAAVKVLGEDGAKKLIQKQPRGTCGGRAGSAAGDFVQLIAIAAGKPIVFRRCSHAAIYFAARKKYGMLGGDWRDDGNDGVASGSVPEALGDVCGYVTRDEDGDTNYYGDGSDDLACKLGAGLLPDLAAKILEVGRDNMVVERYIVRSADEAADAVAAGGYLIGSDSQGFNMTRDRYGFCSPQGVWQHYQGRCGVERFDSTRDGFPYFQSWGTDSTGGPLLPGYPPNVHGVDYAVQDQIIKSRGARWEAIFGFPEFEVAKGVDLPWMW